MSVTEKPAHGDIPTLSASTEQGDNPDETGITVFQAIDLLEESAKKWGDQQQRRFGVLRALVALSRKQPDAATRGFTAQDLWEKVNETQSWLPLQRDPQAISKVVRNEVNRLREANLGHEASLSKACLERGYGWWPVISAIVGGGATNPTRYRIETRPITDMTRIVISKRTAAAPEEVQYEIDISVRLNFYLRRVEKGLVFKGRTRTWYLAWGAILVIGNIVLAGLAGFALIVDRQPLPVVLVFALYGWLVYSELLPPYRVAVNKIQKAPTLVQGFDDRLLLEWRGKPRYPASELHVVRYLGVCPLCSGVVNVDKRRWWSAAEDLAGRCENAPRQHVFTFDHELKIGIRIPPNI